MNQLEEARETIDAIDEQLAALFEKRMNASAQVAAYKKAHNLPILDGAREKEVVEKNAARIENEQFRPYFEDWIVSLMELSKQRQRELNEKVSVAYCGIEGAFAHSIASRLFPYGDLDGMGSFDEVFEAVQNGKVQYGVLPLENTNSGMVGEVLDGLMMHDVFISAQADVQIHQCLLGIPGSSLQEIEWVYSKDQALWQCQGFLKSLNVQPIPYPNTALAAQFVSSNKDRTKAAIGSKDNAALYGLQVLAENIEADSSNTTRFIVIAKRPNKDEGEFASFLISLSNEVGSLARAINVISAFGLNMNCLLSRPRKGHPFEYFFYIQTEGQIPKEKMETCLAALDQICAYSRFLGTYSIRKETTL